jgi:hypothetical protein
LAVVAAAKVIMVLLGAPVDLVVVAVHANLLPRLSPVVQALSGRATQAVLDKGRLLQPSVVGAGAVLAAPVESEPQALVAERGASA